MEVSTRPQALALPAPETLKNKEDKATQVIAKMGSEATYVDKETQVSVEDNQEERQVCRTTSMILRDNR